MTEEIEAHVLKKYEILQKLGTQSHPLFLSPQLIPSLLSYSSLINFLRQRSLWNRLEGN